MCDALSSHIMPSRDQDGAGWSCRGVPGAMRRRCALPRCLAFPAAGGGPGWDVRGGRRQSPESLLSVLTWVIWDALAPGMRGRRLATCVLHDKWSSGRLDFASPAKRMDAIQMGLQNWSLHRTSGAPGTPENCRNQLKRIVTCAGVIFWRFFASRRTSKLRAYLLGVTDGNGRMISPK